MSAFVYKKKFRGVEVTIAGNRIGIVIQEALPQQGGAPTIGLSDKLLEFALKFNKTIYVSVKYPQVSFKTLPDYWMKHSKKEEQPSYYNTPWYIYRGEIPRSAFKGFGKTEEEKEKERFYQSYCFV